MRNFFWSYINIDDTWQGKRDSKTHALQGGDNFPDMKGLCDEIHKMGLKTGIYSSPWVTTYGGHAGSSSDNSDGSWSQALANNAGHHPGKYSFVQVDANQWAAWGFDYLKYDWDTVDVYNTMQMSKALRKTGRDFVFSLSNTAPFEHAANWARWANCWRTTSDIRDAWVTTGEKWQFQLFQPIGGVSAIFPPTTMRNFFWSSPFAFFAWNTTVYSPFFLSEPVICPVAESTDKPAGRFSMLNVIGRSPVAGIV